jgi:hypothetical protein
LPAHPVIECSLPVLLLSVPLLSIPQETYRSAILRKSYKPAQESSNMVSASAIFTAMMMGSRPAVQTMVWLLNIMNLACAFPGIWVLLPVRPKQHQVLPALYCSLVITTIYALAEHLAVVLFRAYWRPSWIWVVAISPMHLWCATLCLIVRQEIRLTRTEHLEKDSAEQYRVTTDSWWKGDPGLTTICLIPTVTLNATTSAAMLVLEKESDQPLPPGWTPPLKATMNCFTVAIFAVSRYADYMILRSGDRQSSHFLCGRDVVIGSVGVLSLFAIRSLCDALMPVSALGLLA